MGHDAKTCPVETAEQRIAAAKYDAVIIGASIHYGRHPRRLYSLIHHYRVILDGRPNAFFSVSLSAGGPGAKPEAAERYLDKFLKQVNWRPQQTAKFAGALQFSKYRAFKRLLMVTFVGLAGGETDTSRDYEYTDWSAVDEFANSFVQRLARPRNERVRGA
jgi:menaquinone-dependent protoporphyrinogen oxidase